MLEIRNLEKSFGKKNKSCSALTWLRKRIHLRFDREEWSREDTIFHSILRFQNTVAISSWVAKQSVKETYKEVGYLPEERSSMPKLTIFEQVRYLANLKGMSAAEVKEKLPIWMEKTLQGKLTDKIKSLSKGISKSSIDHYHDPWAKIDHPRWALAPSEWILSIQSPSSRSSLKKRTWCVHYLLRPRHDQCGRTLWWVGAWSVMDLWFSQVPTEVQ